jgi:UDP:flavonoid glycosyltransferase YjiC (YdhE family)
LSFEENIIYAPFLNISYIISKVDLVLTHGGNGSIYQALYGGVPVLCYPVIFEQEWNVRRIADLGFGDMIPKHFTADKLKKIIEKWIGTARSEKFKRISNRIKYYQDNLKENINRAISSLSGAYQYTRTL